MAQAAAATSTPLVAIDGSTPNTLVQELVFVENKRKLARLTAEGEGEVVFRDLWPTIKAMEKIGSPKKVAVIVVPLE